MLPDGFTPRPVEPRDLDEVAALVSDCELADLGRTWATREDIAAEWAQPNFDLGSDAILIQADERIVAQAESFRRRAEARIHPDVRNQGVGTWILGWIENRGRAKGETKSRQTILDSDFEAAAMLRSHGYEVGYVNWVLEIELDQEPPVPLTPQSVHLRKFMPGKDDRQVYRVIEEAFNELPEREPISFEDWAVESIQRPDFDPELVDVAEHEGDIVGAIVGFEYQGEGGWIGQLAVRTSHRGRGIAKALLYQAFLTAWQRGNPACGLATDSRTGALGLYEQVGMRVTTTATNFVKVL